MDKTKEKNNNVMINPDRIHSSLHKVFNGGHYDRPKKSKIIIMKDLTDE